MAKVRALLYPFIFFTSLFRLEFCRAIDTITSTQPIRDPGTVVSVPENFRLGFFSPGNSTKRYVGIWYDVTSGPTATLVWVANRENPLSDSSGVFTIADDGNLVVLDGRNNIMWSTNVSKFAGNSSAELLDSGNLVLREENSNGRVLWQSFDHPVDSFLPKMKVGASLITGETQLLTAWKSDSDPSIGRFSAGISLLNLPQIFIWDGSIPHWRSGPWNNRIFIGIPDMYSVYLNGFNIIRDNVEGSLYVTFDYVTEAFPKFVLTYEGKFAQTNWDDKKKKWVVRWLAPENECDIYGKCGQFGICNPLNSPICSCLGGFEPKSMEEWSKGNWTGGCMRRTQLQCKINNTSRDEGKEDGFLKLEMTKVPDSAIWLSAEDVVACKNQCSSNCSCVAFAYESGIGCMSWMEKLIDIQEFSVGGVDLHIRVAYSELDKKRDVKVIIIITMLIGTIAIGICTYFSWRWMAKQRGTKKKEMENSQFGRGEAFKETLDASMVRYNRKQQEGLEIPFFNFEDMVIATNNFHGANKLGQGGFGPVYKELRERMQGQDRGNSMWIFDLDLLKGSPSKGGEVGHSDQVHLEAILCRYQPLICSKNDCDIYSKCGPFGSCNALNSQICSCLRGYEPKSTEEWSKGNWRSVCVRRTQLQCERNNGSRKVGKQDGFLKLEMMKVPDSANWLSAEDLAECEDQCLRNCSCVAFAYDSGIGCMSWSGNLIDIHKLSMAGVDLHIRVAYSEFGRKKKRIEKLKFDRREASKERDNMMQRESFEIPFFNFENMVIATNNFHGANKLGQGGFGPVYKVVLLHLIVN
ncbi:hypothetical protein HHK36_003803 [Tetracentron sinense]|uniref:Receptor-like serine/threonine-protein kinase n=1 Tax=Tetracentron sinense TaxID=13715 RepID=A0A835DPN0_TETSI|nr:hypothetical protein HHK36_003803 [Tetracentron sinense]